MSISTLFATLASRIPLSPQLVSQDSMMFDATKPQGCPIIISRSKSTSEELAFSTTTSQQVESSTSTSQSQQPSIASLASYGIKVRDFAYESTLPPIAPVRRYPRQIQPGVKPLKRLRHNDDEYEDDVSSQESQGSPAAHGPKKIKLERKPTEPIGDPSNDPPVSALPLRRGFANFGSLSISTSFKFPMAKSLSEWPPFSPPFHHNPESQRSEPYIHTPIVTPNGSLQWQLGESSSTPIPQIETTLKAAASKPITYSRSRLSLVDTPSNERITSITSSPLTELSSSSILLPHFSSPHSSPRPSVQHSGFPLPRAFSPPPDPSNPVPTDFTSPRYYLRKRPAAIPPAQSPVKRPPARNRRSRAKPTTKLPSRPLSFSVQSSHSQQKGRNEKDSPRLRTLRKRSSVNKGG